MSHPWKTKLGPKRYVKHIYPALHSSTLSHFLIIHALISGLHHSAIQSRRSRQCGSSTLTTQERPSLLRVLVHTGGLTRKVSSRTSKECRGSTACSKSQLSTYILNFHRPRYCTERSSEMALRQSQTLWVESSPRTPLYSGRPVTSTTSKSVKWNRKGWVTILSVSYFLFPCFITSYFTFILNLIFIFSLIFLVLFFPFILAP